VSHFVEEEEEEEEEEEDNNKENALLPCPPPKQTSFYLNLRIWQGLSLYIHIIINKRFALAITMQLFLFTFHLNDIYALYVSAYILINTLRIIISKRVALAATMQLRLVSTFILE